MRRVFIYTFVATLIFVATYLFLKKYSPIKNESNITKDINITLKSIKNSLDDKNVSVKKEEITILKVKPSKYILATEALDYEEAKKLSKEQNITQIKNYKPLCKVEKKETKKRVFNKSNPTLVIIMDDISSQKEIDRLNSLGMKITPSIFPSTKTHKDTPLIASKLKHYMVHTPMQAFNYKHPEIGTLDVNDSLKTIERSILKIHKDFPNLAAINNHTGSRFTSDIKAMDRLFCALKKYNINFIDSKTAPHTFGKKMGRLYGMPVFCRDVFLDNKADVEYILKQIRLAVKKAKKSGLCIAICHPRQKTFVALREAKNLLLGVKLIYVDELYR